MDAMEIYSGSTGINSEKLGMLNLHMGNQWIYRELKKIEKRKQRTRVHIRIPNQHKYEEWKWDGERLHPHPAYNEHLLFPRRCFLECEFLLYSPNNPDRWVFFSHLSLSVLVGFHYYLLPLYSEFHLQFLLHGSCK